MQRRYLLSLSLVGALVLGACLQPAAAEAEGLPAQAEPVLLAAATPVPARTATPKRSAPRGRATYGPSAPVRYVSPPPKRTAKAVRPPLLKLTGVYDRATELAVAQYQRNHGMPGTGIADQRTTWGIGLVNHAILFRGCRGPAVRALQRALVYHDRVYGNTKQYGLRRLTGPQHPVATPHPYVQPTFAPPLEFVIEPTPVPIPTPSPTPVPVAKPAGPGWPVNGEVWGGAWFGPGPATDTSPRWTGGALLYYGPVGLMGSYTLAPDFGGQAAGDIIDAQLRTRFGPGWLGLGYRGFAGESLGALSLGLDQPLGFDWLRLRAQGTGAGTLAGTWMADVSGGLAVRVWALQLGAEYRAAFADGLGGLTGQGSAFAPQVTAGLAF